MITAIDVAWAAGFIEGEGCFATKAGNGVTVMAAQVQREPLERLQRIFGGAIGKPRIRKNYNAQPISRWDVHGLRAAAVTMTVFAFLSPRRKGQALRLLDQWKESLGKGGAQRAKTHCPHGHEYTSDNIYHRQGDRAHFRQCRTCAINASKNVYLRKKAARLAVVTNT